MSSSFLNDFRTKTSLWREVGEAEIPASDGLVLLMDNETCINRMKIGDMNLPIVQEIDNRELNRRDTGMATGKSKVFGFEAREDISLEFFFNENLTPLSEVALTQSQLALLLHQIDLSTNVLAYDVKGRKNITILRHGRETYFLQVALYQFGFPTFHFLESIEGVFLEKGEGFFFALPSEE